MDTDRMMKAVKKLLLTKSMQKSSNKLRNLQTGDHGERKNLPLKRKNLRMKAYPEKNLRMLQDPPDPPDLPDVQAKQVSHFLIIWKRLREYKKSDKP